MIVIAEEDLIEWAEQLDATASVVAFTHQCEGCAADLERIREAIRKELELA